MKIWQESPAQLSSAIKLCSLALYFDLWITSLLTPNLVTTIVCYPSFSWCLLLCNQKLCHVKILLGCMFSNGATISDLRCRDETESLLWVHTQGCAARHVLVSEFLVMIHYRTAPMCYFHASSSLVISPYLIERSLY